MKAQRSVENARSHSNGLPHSGASGMSIRKQRLGQLSLIRPFLSG